MEPEELLFVEGIDEDDDEGYIHQLAILGVLIYAGADESRRLRSERRRAHRTYLVRDDLLPNPRLNTPWQVMYDGQNDRAFITTMGFDVASFQCILHAGFAELWCSNPIPRNDTRQMAVPRPARRSLDPAGALGLVLHYLNSTMREVSLMQIFALIPSTVSRYIRFSLDILLLTLKQLPEGRIHWPDGDEFQENNDLIVARHPLLTGAFGTMDGLNLAVQTSDDQEIENATYNGWLHDHFVSSVLSFSAQGLIIACRLNAPGSWHDSRVAQPIYEKLRTQTPEGYYLVTDTAFPRGTSQIAGRIKAPIKEGQRLPLDPLERQSLLAFDRQLLSFRQSTEWGMRSLQGSFGRLRVPLEVSYIDKRGDLLETCVRLHNARTEMVGINQIRTVYMPIWKADEQEEIWAHFENMLFGEQREKDRVSRFHHIY
ncbi:hypothetical protein BV22DRAFT_1001525 [Leucogyrophana mollusca]|uniref:Uncharacterized protein n=1 Tax=Leucogyrophana mollusca TaxID=85980 RepID=A0ACB8BZN1_9AGAM|nr:hypothetical protein BV22DRAFT_1001525 [Leucogyrophana mollusca]